MSFKYFSRDNIIRERVCRYEKTPRNARPPLRKRLIMRDREMKKVNYRTLIKKSHRDPHFRFYTTLSVWQHITVTQEQIKTAEIIISYHDTYAFSDVQTL